MVRHRYRGILRRHRRVSSICVARSRVGPPTQLEFGLRNFAHVDDPNRGGSTSKVPMMTVPNAAKILRHDYYGWFERVERGVYALSPAGRRGLESFTPPDGRSRLRRC